MLGEPGATVVSAEVVSVSTMIPDRLGVGFFGGLTAYVVSPTPITAAAPTPIAIERSIIALRRFF